MKYTLKFLWLTLLAFIMVELISSCNKDESLPYYPSEEIRNKVVPNSISDNNLAIIDGIRALAKENGFEDDFLDENPRKWGNKNLQVIWEKDYTNHFFIVGIESGVDSCGLSTLVISSEKNTALAGLRIINLKNANKLKELVLYDMPNLEDLRLIGCKDNINPNDKLERFMFKGLPSLRSLSFKHFPKLRGTNDREDTFKFHYYYNYPKLKFIHLENTGITDLYVEIDQVVNELKLIKNNDLTFMYLDNVELPSLVFTPDTYPGLQGLTLKHLPESCASKLVLRGYPEFENLTVSKCPSIKSIDIRDMNKLNNLTCSYCNLENIEEGLGEGLSSLRTFSIEGNQLKTCKLDKLPSVFRVDLWDNCIASSDDIDFPLTLGHIKLTGNDQLESLDLMKYSLLQRLVVSGTKRGAEKIDPENPNKLSVVKVPNSNELFTIYLENNSIRNIFEEGQTFPALESIVLAYNELTPLGLANVVRACKDSGIRFTKKRDFNVSNQRKFYKEVVNGNTVDFSEAIKVFKEIGLDEDDLFDVELYEEDDDTDVDEELYEFNKQTGILTINESGKYYVRIIFNDHYLSRAIRKSQKYGSQLLEITAP